jgi:hypothetical protein
MRSRCEYLTARCPYGCEVWLHPRAVAPHHDRCPGHRWTDQRLPITNAALSHDQADLARRICPPEQLHRPEISGDRLLNPRPGMRIHDGLIAGVVVESPIPAVTGRRWWTVLRAAHGQGWSTDLALEPESFRRIEERLGLVDHFATCTICGDDITPRRMTNHHKANSVCRFLADTAEVRTFWNLGYRDPFLLQGDGVPTTWTELNSRVTWRNRLHIVHFRLWTAVMISAGEHLHQQQGTAPVL